MHTYLPKGARVRAQWLQARPLLPIAGMQHKAMADVVDITGTVAHLRGDDPVRPTVVRLYILPDDPPPDWVPRTRPYGCTCPGHDQCIEVNSDHVVEVLQ